MEIRARYVQMGAFTLAVIAAAFGFVYWLNNVGGLRERAIYRVHFESPVSGLLRGSAVLFNGIRVGEVTRLELNSDNPRQVQATIAVDRGTPVRADTAVGIDFQGLTGSPVIALTGGSSTSPLAGASGEPAVLVADPAAGQSMSQAARDVLRRIDGVLAENAQPLRNMIANLDTFAGALARNSDRLDGIVAGLERMTGGAAARARAVVYDLTVPRTPAVPEKTLAAQLVIPDPTALAALDTEKIQSTSAGGVTSALPDAQWSDTLPRLLQMKIIRSFEDAKALAGVSRPLEGLIADFQLFIDIRKFQVLVSPALTAEVEFAGKVVDNKGRIVATRVFHATAPAAADGAPAAAAALDQAFGKAAADLVLWGARTITDQYEGAGTPKDVAPRRATKG
jgi:phospholipid/cholesterol/gamma-HCH transport system substrate-binding protein